MNTRLFPLSVVEVIDLIISGREKLATELIGEIQQKSYKKNKKG